MTLDLLSMMVATSLVVVTAGLVYLAETLLRKDGLAGRLWSVAFLAGIFTVLSYIAWAAAAPDGLVAVAVGNAAFAATTGLMWLGCRAFNQRPLRIPALIVAAGILLAFASALLHGDNTGGWSGAVPHFAVMVAFAAAGAVETRRGRLGSRWNSLGLTVALAAQALFFLGRLVSIVAVGPEDPFFLTWFGSEAAAVLTIVLTVVAVITTSVLRASESTLHGHRDTYLLRVGIDGVLTPASFCSVVRTLLSRAEGHRETVCMIAVWMDDLVRLATAFGPGEADAVAAAWRQGVRRHAPTAALIGEYDDDTLLVAFVTTPFTDVRRTAALIHRRLLDELGELDTSVVPSVGVGVACTDVFGYDFDSLAAAAEDAAERSVSSPDASVIVAER